MLASSRSSSTWPSPSHQNGASKSDNAHLSLIDGEGAGATGVIFGGERDL
jgi:hypothetical protein